ncbi:MAG: SAM-dependent methyltransferase [Lawsonibacter sp.]
MEVTLIGMGPGDPSALTGGALTALERADVLIGSRRLVEGCTLAPEAQRFCSTKSAEIVEILAEGRWERPCVLYSGDTGFHSGTRTLLPPAGGAWDQLAGAPRCVQYAVFCRAAGPSLAGVAGGLRPRAGLRPSGGRCWPPGDGLCSSSPAEPAGRQPCAAAWPGPDWAA